MNAWILLMRGINVGGRNVLPMKQLREILEEAGCECISTYIQSGNAVFNHAESNSRKLASRIRSAVSADCGFEPAVLLLTVEEFEQAIARNPFMDGTADPKTVHLSFLSEQAKDPDIEGINAIKSSSERFELIERVFYLYAPDGIGRSKLAAKAERLLGVDVTARNWRTVSRLQELALNLAGM